MDYEVAALLMCNAPGTIGLTTQLVYAGVDADMGLAAEFSLAQQTFSAVLDHVEHTITVSGPGVGGCAQTDGSNGCFGAYLDIGAGVSYEMSVDGGAKLGLSFSPVGGKGGGFGWETTDQGAINLNVDLFFVGFTVPLWGGGISSGEEESCFIFVDCLMKGIGSSFR